MIDAIFRRRRVPGPADASLRAKQRKINHIQPTQDAVDDRPEYRVVGGVGYRHGKGRTKAHAVFCSLDSNSVKAISVHIAASASAAGCCKECHERGIILMAAQ